MRGPSISVMRAMVTIVTAAASTERTRVKTSTADAPRPSRSWTISLIWTERTWLTRWKRRSRPASGPPSANRVRVSRGTLPKSSFDWLTSGIATAATTPMARAAAATVTALAASQRGQRRRSSQATAGATATARISAMSTQTMSVRRS